MDFDVPTHFLNISLHHVHADATAGNVGHLLGGRKARRENQHADVFVAHAVADRQPL
ncbi:hypothetical protein D3C80_1213440 [compost metagenome]